ncbi:SCO-spondin-like, partial [Amblyraja radiata]|uniref:SCO-spondin-like n=1 Tax=Amblyraja radiata TaxID=386614 RepID=UPI0014034EDC
MPLHVSAHVLLLLLLLARPTLAPGHGCVRTVRESRLERVTGAEWARVPCAGVSRLLAQGWSLERGRPHSDRHDPSTCLVHRRPAPRVVWTNRTVNVCCDGSAGPSCPQDAEFLGRCYTTAACWQLTWGSNASDVSMESCCGDQQGRSWSNRAGVCLPCPPLTSTDITGQGSVVRFRAPRAASTPLPLGAVLLGSGQVWPLGPTMLVPGRDRPLGPTMLVSGRDWPRAACVTWSGVHYRTFDGRHFTFGGSCTYTLAAGLDGTWSVHLSTPPCTGSVRTECPKALRAMFGLDLVLIENGTVVINGALLSPGQSHLHS